MGEIDLGEFRALSSRRSKPLCKVGLVRESLSGEERRKLDAACAAADIRTGAIVEWLKRVAGGAPVVSVSAVTSHRRRTCTCADG